MTGVMHAGEQTITVDLHLNRDGSSVGTLSIDDAVQPVRAVGGVYFVQMTSSYIHYLVVHGGNAALYAPMTNKWVSSAAGAESLPAKYATLLSYTLFFKTVTQAKDPVALHAAGLTTLDGRSVALYTTAQGDRFYVSATGPAYLLLEDGSRTDSSGSLSFSWNQPVTVTTLPASDIIN